MLEILACFCTTGEIGENDEACSAAKERTTMHNRNRAVDQLRWVVIVIMLVVPISPEFSSFYDTPRAENIDCACWHASCVRFAPTKKRVTL